MLARTPCPALILGYARAMRASPSATIPGFRTIRELGRGGMATVYLAIQESLGHEVAIKLLSPALSVDPVASERFLREGRIAARLLHRNIVGIVDVGVHQGQPYQAVIDALMAKSPAVRSSDGAAGVRRIEELQSNQRS